MKRILFVLTVLSILTLAACGEPEVPKTEFEQAIYNLEEAESVTMKMTMKDLPIVGDMVGTVKTDGIFSQIDMLGTIEYQVLYDGMLYDLVDIGNIYIPFESDLIDETIEDNPLLAIDEIDTLTDEDFEIEEGVYTLIEDFEGLTGFVLTIEEDYLVSMEFEVSMEGFDIDIIIEFIDYNDTNFAIPTHVDVERFIPASLFLNESFVMVYGSEHFSLNGDTFVIDCVEDNCFVEDEYGTWIFPERDGFYVYDGESEYEVDLETFYNDFEPAFTIEEYQALKVLFEELF